MNLHDIPPQRPPIRGLQKEVEQLQRRISQLEAENTWLKQLLENAAVQNDKQKRK